MTYRSQCHAFCRALALLVGLAVALALGAAAQTDLPKVTVAKPRNHDANETVKLPAILNPDERVSVYAKIAGYVDTIAVDKGDVVKKGQIIAKISVPEMGPELALAKAKAGAVRARLGKSQASVEVETATHHRLDTLHTAEPGAVTEEDVEVSAAKEKIARAEAEAVKAEINVADAEVKRLIDLMAYLDVAAPFDGTVIQRNVDPGAYVEPSSSNAKPLFEIAWLAKLRLAFDLPERLVPFVKQGFSLRYSLTALPAKVFDGVVARRTESLTEDAHTMRLEIDVDNREALLSPGMYGSVQIPFDNVPGAGLLPASAVRTIDGKTCVLAVEDGIIRKMLVEPLVNDGKSVIVAGELKPDTLVVVNGPASLAEGQRVEPVEAG